MNQAKSLWIFQQPARAAKADHHVPYRGPAELSIALLRNGEVIYMLERKQIENLNAQEIAAKLTAAFDTLCAAVTRS